MGFEYKRSSKKNCRGPTKGAFNLLISNQNLLTKFRPFHQVEND